VLIVLHALRICMYVCVYVYILIFSPLNDGVGLVGACNWHVLRYVTC
jgi:hypothetical protein